MSLYNNTQKRIDSMVSGAVSNMAMNVGNQLAKNLVNKFVPANARKVLGTANKVLGDYNSGGMNGVAMGLLRDYGGLIAGQGSLASQAQYWNKNIPLFGGVTPAEAARIYTQMHEHQFAKKNLFLVQVRSKLEDDGISSLFNMFATEVDYAPFTVTGDKRKVGGANIYSVQSAESVEMRITTMDDANGTIKRWFANHAAAAVASDGTVGVPNDYAIEFKISHAKVMQPEASNGLQSQFEDLIFGFNSGSSGQAYQDIGLYCPANLECSLSRREDGLEEIQMTFSQLDTFMTY